MDKRPPLVTDVGHKGLAGLVLAAGASIRLGQPKQLVTIDGRSLLQHAVDKCLPVCPLGVTVVTGADREVINQTLRGESVLIMHNSAWRDGLASSIIADTSRCAATSLSIIAGLASMVDRITTRPWISVFGKVDASSTSGA